MESFIGTSIDCACFVGDGDKIAVVGGAGRAGMRFDYYALENEVLYNEDGSDFSDKGPLKLRSKLHKPIREPDVKGVCAAMEVCGEGSAGHANVALAIGSSLYIRDFESMDEPTIIKSEEPGNSLSCLAYSSDQHVLAVGTEYGNIDLYNFYSSNIQQEHKFKSILADPCGVIDMCFNRNGQLIVAGKSAAKGPQLWDFRVGKFSGQNQNQIKADSLVLNFGAGSAIFGGFEAGSHDSKMTCVRPHPISDTVYVGYEDGSIQEWDIRAGGKPCRQVLSDALSVTGLVLHPIVRDALIVSFADGTIREIMLHNKEDEIAMGNVNVILQEMGAPIVALDSHSVRKRLMAATSCGNIQIMKGD
jgi:WD40 repeat protein